MGKYRWRTSIRTRLPWAFVWMFPKGRHDCGDHDWYRQDDEILRCYHCKVGVKKCPRAQR